MIRYEDGSTASATTTATTTNTSVSSSLSLQLEDYDGRNDTLCSVRQVEMANVSQGNTDTSTSVGILIMLPNSIEDRLVKLYEIEVLKSRYSGFIAGRQG